MTRYVIPILDYLKLILQLLKMVECSLTLINLPVTVLHFLSKPKQLMTYIFFSSEQAYYIEYDLIIKYLGYFACCRRTNREFYENGLPILSDKFSPSRRKINLIITCSYSLTLSKVTENNHLQEG